MGTLKFLPPIDLHSSFSYWALHIYFRPYPLNSRDVFNRITRGVKVSSWSFCQRRFLRTSETTAQIEEIININPSKYKDPVFISIDTEGLPAREIGISILDTRDLGEIVSSKDIVSPSRAQPGTLIYTFNYHLERNAKAEWGRPFQFGRSQLLKPEAVYLLLQKIFPTGHPDACHQEPRNTILVGHNIAGDISSLEWISGQSWSVQIYPYVLHFDTQSLRQVIIGGILHTKLSHILLKLRVPHKYLHNSGNDSNFTLKALLALAVRDCPFNQYCSPQILARKKLLRALAEMPMPPTILDHLEPVDCMDFIDSNIEIVKDLSEGRDIEVFQNPLRQLDIRLENDDLTSLFEIHDVPCHEHR